MRLRFMTKGESGWEKEKPADPSKWLWRHDGTESVAIDDENSVYYVGRPEMVDAYRDAWAKEKNIHDNRKAAMFIELDRVLYGMATV